MGTKLITIICLTICCLAGFSAGAQSFSLAAPGNVPVNNGDTITLTGTTNDGDLFGHLYLTNNSGNSKSVVIYKEHLSLVPSCDVVFQFGLYMYPPMTFLTPYGTNVAAGAIDSSFYTGYIHNGIAGTSFVKFTFFDENNPADSTWMVYKFEITQATGNSDFAGKPKRDIYPNPTSDYVKIHNPSSDPVLVSIMDANGKQVQQFTGYSRELLIDLYSLPKGSYFIFVEAESGNSPELYKVLKQ